MATFQQEPGFQAAALYFGRVMHKRLRPFQHRFDYRVVSLWLDIDKVAATARRHRLLSHNRLNLFSFHDRDHGPRDGSPLRPWCEALLGRHGIDIAGGPVWLLTFPRVFGYVFNPLSLYYCHHADGHLAAVIYEVSNTFGEQHSYVLPVDDQQPAQTPVVQSCEKDFYVSPFIGMSATYHFRLTQPDDRLSMLIRQADADGDLLLATLTARRLDLTDGALARAFVTHPMMTWKVIAAIHWQALHLWRKGARYHPRSAAAAKVRPV